MKVRACLSRAAVAVFAALTVPTLVGAQGEPVNLQPQVPMLSSVTTRQFLARLDSDSVPQYGLADFGHQLTPAERQELSESGIHILSHFEGTTYRVAVTRQADKSRIERAQIGLLLLEPGSKVALPIWQRRFDEYLVNLPDGGRTNYVLNRDSSLNLLVRFYPTVAEGTMRRLLRAHAREFERREDTQWLAVVAQSQLASLAAANVVEWIDAAPPPFLPDNDVTRTVAGVERVQQFDIASGTVQGLGGRGVGIGIFDSGVDQTHDDFGNRIVVNDHGSRPHATHVAGVAAGNGRESNGSDNWGRRNGGTAFQWRGMAPEAELIDASSGYGGNASRMQRYIGAHGMDLSNHSYSFAFDGAYDDDTATRDRTIRGDAVVGGSPVPARLQIYSAGNHGLRNTNGGQQVGFFAITKQVKNALVVGNIGPSMIGRHSSLGPAHDGRIKPDVVAPGIDIRSTGGCLTCRNRRTGVVGHHDYYYDNSGTSMAAPVVSGVVALVLQQYAATYGVDLDVNPPWPSTLRAVIIHSARDIVSPGVWFRNADADVQAFPGPDFVTGWGMVQGGEAVELVQRRLIVQGEIRAACDTATFLLPLAAAGPLRVTLAWDDVPGNPALARTAPKLVNDLDLVLLAPDGTPHYPWLLDQQAVDAAGTPVPDARQVCGTPLRVNRAVLPTSTPRYRRRNDPIDGTLRAAGRGRDHLNNVEQVEVAAAAPGTWRVQVIGFSVPQGPQRFSLVGLTPQQ